MTPHNRMSLRKVIAVSLVGAALFGTTLGLGGCTIAPKSIPDASVSENEGSGPEADVDCGANCGDEDGIGRYQYYLGILSVLLIG